MHFMHVIYQLSEIEDVIQVLSHFPFYWDTLYLKYNYVVFYNHFF